MSWRLALSDQARKDLRSLDPVVADRILRALQRVADTEQGDVKRLKGKGGLMRFRVGDWRVLFEVSRGTMEVLGVHHRSSAYRK